jgi:drug/metabolite transporter (DMT)-like permease
MKVIGIILIVAGIAMLIFRGFNVQTEEKVLDAGPLQINKKENKWIGWPVYAGAIAIIAGIVLVATDKGKKLA